MAVTMPPQTPAYQIERAAPTDAMAQGVRAVSESIRRVAERARAAITPEPSQMERTLPAIDTASRALTRDDRLALASTISQNDRGTLASRTGAPNSYVGDRIRLAVDLSRMQQRGIANVPAAEQVAFRCRITAVAMDARAGRYVEGGEAAASRARAQVPQETLAACRDTISARREATMSTARASDLKPAVRAIDPQAGRPVQPTRVSLEASQRDPVRVDLPAQRRVHIEFAPQKRVNIDPIARQNDGPSRGVQAACAGSAAGREA